MNSLNEMAEESRASKTPEAVSIETRKFKTENFDDLPEYFYENDPFETHFVSGLSILFPEGERFFIKSVLAYKDQIDDPKLLKEIKDFSAQEAQHTLVHEAMNRMVAEKGYPVEACEDFLRKILRPINEKAKTNNFYKRAALATTVCMEHFTAIIAYQALTNGDVLFEKAHPSISKMFEWHAVEETEHKSVAFDVYQEVDGSAIFLRAMMIVASIGFLGGTFINTCAMMKHDGSIKNIKVWGRGFQFLFGRREGFLSKPFFDWLAFFKPGFHPWNQHKDLDTEMALKELEPFMKELVTNQ